MKTIMRVDGKDTHWPFMIEPLLKMKVRLKGVDYRVSEITLEAGERECATHEQTDDQRIVELTQIADSFPTPEEMAKEDKPDDSD